MQDMKPLTCTADMARAYHEGRKTQTRRLIKGIRKGYVPDCICEDGSLDLIKNIPLPMCTNIPGKHKVGDVLYVAEPWGVGCRPHPIEGWIDGIEYQSDEFYLEDDIEDLPIYTPAITDDFDYGEYEGQGWQPAKTMPLGAARTFLQVTGIRAERVQEITEADEGAEGVLTILNNYPRQMFKQLYNSIYGPEAWNRNDYTFVYETKNVERPTT